MDFHGFAVGSCETSFLRIEYLKDAGPRIVRLYFGDSPVNLLAEAPQAVTGTSLGEYRFLGGHRLWHAPEANPRSYIRDHEGLDVQSLPDGVRLTQAVEAQTGIRKSMEIRLHGERAALTVQHRLENMGLWAVELAPWAITQLRHGGVSVMPLQRPGSERDGLLADRLLAVWPYTRLGDPRLRLEDDACLLEGKEGLSACKIGTFNRRGWTGYLLPGVFFNKRFSPHDDQPHVDFGCNNEVYVDNRFIEVETLGPLTKLEPGQAVTHRETWELTGDLDYPTNVDGVRALIRDLDLP